MAIIRIDGFDLYSVTVPISARWSVTGSTPTYQTGRFAGQCVRLPSTSAIMAAVTLGDTFAVGFAHRAVGLAGGFTFALRFRNSTTLVDELNITDTGALRWTQNGTQKGISAANLIVDSVWNYIEIEFTRSASVGVFTVYLNGTSVLTASAQNLGASQIDNILITGTNGSNDVDDFYMTNVATKLGESRVDTIRPSADTAQKNWTPSTGTNNSANVDETTYNGDTDYNSSSTVGNYDLFDVTDMAFTPSTVRAVQAVVCARKDDATTRQIRSKLKSGATTQNGATTSLTTTYNTNADIYETDPNTGSAWAASAVNAAQLGVEVVT